MISQAAITVLRPREEVERLWNSSQYKPDSDQITISFKDAPGDRGTEIHGHVPLSARGGKLGQAVKKFTGGDPLAKLKDDMRRFKQEVETGEIARSEALPEGELAERKLKARPAQPLEQDELEKAGV